MIPANTLTTATRAACGLTLLLAGCSPPPMPVSLAPANVRAGASDPDIYPLTVGMSWTYRLTQTKDGLENPTPGAMSSRVVSVENRNGIKVAKVERTYGANVIPATAATQGTDGVVLARWEATAATQARLLPLSGVSATQQDRAYPEGELTTSLRILQFPLKADASWTGRVWTFAKETLTATGWESLTVPAGTYRSWHVTHRLTYEDGRFDTLGYWYAPGIGMVKAHEENTLIFNDKPVKYSVDGILTGVKH
ncbi:MAG: hypothetical protein H7338_23020 [Candidatus Sericytochromatia bacterium]|nr:hypothetical protein [Candidatus Sericytochromatia bacterium]